MEGLQRGETSQRILFDFTKYTLIQILGVPHTLPVNA